MLEEIRAAVATEDAARPRDTVVARLLGAISQTARRVAVSLLSAPRLRLRHHRGAQPAVPRLPTIQQFTGRVTHRRRLV